MRNRDAMHRNWMPFAECLDDQGVRNMRVKEPGVIPCVEMRASAVTVARCPDKDTRGRLVLTAAACPQLGGGAQSVSIDGGTVDLSGVTVVW
jgi:hypothetical protein